MININPKSKFSGLIATATHANATKNNDDVALRTVALIEHALSLSTRKTITHTTNATDTPINNPLSIFLTPSHIHKKLYQ
jgi:hypothetical protein